MLKESNLHDYQNTVWNHIINNSHCGVFLDMGLGKTVSTLTAANKLMFEELEISRVLVVAPKRVAENVWSSEIKKWKHLKHLRVSRIIGSAKQRIAAIKTDADIYTIGRDNIPWLCGQFGGNMLPFDMLIIDESSSFKNPKSIRFKALKRVQPCFKRVVILTGTPTPNGLMDLWSQIYLLDQGKRLGKFITEYRRNFFRPGRTNGHVVYNYNIQVGASESIMNKVKDICISMKAKDYLSLPERINNYIELKFSDKLQEQYKDFETEQVLQLIRDTEEETNEEFKVTDISAANAAALSNKLLQYANGAVYDSEKDWHQVHDLKLKAVDEIVEAAQGKPVLIAWTFRHDMYRLMKHLKKYKIRQLRTEQDIEDWNDKKIEIMLMHPASGGHGLNLQTGGNIIVWFGQTWSLELYQQFNARLDRQGQTESVVVNHLVASKTIDNRVIRALSGKETEQESVLAAVKATIKQVLNNGKIR